MGNGKEFFSAVFYYRYLDIGHSSITVSVQIGLKGG